MQIPLDYYRILGVPIQAESHLIQQAYQDGIQQLPHHSYTEYAIVSRKNLMTKAYQILIDPQSRLDYESSFFQNQQTTATGEIYREVSINLTNDLFIGALIILLNLGEYELILRLAIPYLKDKNLAQQELIDPESDSAETNFAQLWQDLVLTFVLANLELAKEKWHDHQYDSAANSLEESYQLLVNEELFDSITTEIKQDLGKLRPYQILELFTKHKDNSQQRNKGLNLLKNLFDSRGGIENPNVDESGLNVDGFLRFIQQIRVYLTAQEQQELFEVEAQRPSSTAAYLAASAYIARGVAEKQADLIVKAKNHLISLTLQQDVYLEQSICALLLAQTTEAEFSLTQSQEQDVIDYIKEMSQDSPDLLPGLCLYTEKWLQTEIFPQFQDLQNQEPSLQEYFADEGVQEYLENLSTPLSNDHEFVPEDFDLPKMEIDYPESDLLSNAEEEIVDYMTDIPKPELIDKDEESPDLLFLEDEIDNQEETESMDVDNFLATDTTSKFSEFVATNEDVSTPQINQQIPNVSPENTPHANINEPRESPQHQRVKRARISQSEKRGKNIILPALITIVGVGAIAFALQQYWLRLSGSNNEQLEISLSEPIIELPAPKNTPDNPGKNQPKNPSNALGEQLDKVKALTIINQWLDAKKEATGPNYNLAPLNQILTQPQLSFWINNSNNLRAINAHRRYEHQIKIISAGINPQNKSQGKITAEVKEKSQYYVNGALRTNSSYEDTLTVEYQLIKKGNQWLISQTKILENNQ